MPIITRSVMSTFLYECTPHAPREDSRGPCRGRDPNSNAAVFPFESTATAVPIITRSVMSTFFLYMETAPKLRPPSTFNTWPVM